jgi:predicted flavoprotein YhiN
VQVFDAMPSAGRKFLLAGRGGLNLTHGEPTAAVRHALPPAHLARGSSRARTPSARRRCATGPQGLGIETFVGSSGRVFPRDLKAAPLLRAWLHRLRAQGVVFHMRHRWRGWADDGALRFDTPQPARRCARARRVLALGGASWPRSAPTAPGVPWLLDAVRGAGAARSPATAASMWRASCPAAAAGATTCASATPASR